MRCFGAPERQPAASGCAGKRDGKNNAGACLQEETVSKQDEQRSALVHYFESGYKPEGELNLGLEVEHFVTDVQGAPVPFEEVQRIMQSMQQPEDTAIVIDGLYMGYNTPRYGVTLEPACQIEISIAPHSDVMRMMDVYNEYYLKLSVALTSAGLRLYTVAYHPTRRAEELPLIPKRRYEAMDRYFKNTGEHGIQMMRATASTQFSIDYHSERDFVQKYRVACLLTPLFALLSDNAPIYQGRRNHSYSVRTQIWQDVDPDRCGVPPHVMDESFGFASYAETVLSRPQIVEFKGGVTKAVGRKTAHELYGGILGRREIEHILSMFFFDVRVKTYIEIRAADCMPQRYIAAYGQLIKTIFGSQAALQNILRHYAGATTGDIANAKVAICKDGYEAWIYGHPVANELAWLLAQVRSRTKLAEERQLLAPFIKLVADKKTIWEEASDE